MALSQQRGATARDPNQNEMKSPYLLTACLQLSTVYKSMPPKTADFQGTEMWALHPQFLLFLIIICEKYLIKTELLRTFLVVQWLRL